MRTSIFGQAVALSHRQQTAPQHAPPLADLDLDLDLDLEMYEDAIVVSSRFRLVSLDRRIGDSGSSQHGKGEPPARMKDWIRQRNLADEGGGGA